MSGSRPPKPPKPVPVPVPASGGSSSSSSGGGGTSSGGGGGGGTSSGSSGGSSSSSKGSSSSPLSRAPREKSQHESPLCTDTERPRPRPGPAPRPAASPGPGPGPGLRGEQQQQQEQQGGALSFFKKQAPPPPPAPTPPTPPSAPAPPAPPASKKNKFLSPEHWVAKQRDEPAPSSTVELQPSPLSLENTNDSKDSKGQAAPSKTSTSTADKAPKGITARTPRQANASQRDMYHSTHFGVEWTYAVLALHIAQFSFLISLGFEAMPLASSVVLLLLVVAVPGIMLLARTFTSKNPQSLDWSYVSIKSPHQESDGVPDSVVFLLSAAAILEGAAYALFSISSTGGDISDSGFKSYATITQILGFSSIVNFGFHSILRPANRLDPLRSILEVEIIGICWDALDGATLYQLLVTSSGLSQAMDTAVRLLMFFWYLSVGCRLAMMYSSHLSPQSRIYQWILPPATTWSDEPTVDRTLAGLNFKSTITLAMSFSQFFAAGLRITLLLRDKLDTVQQEMMVKNLLFLVPSVSAVLKIYQTKGRYWNTRKLLQVKIPYFNIFVNLRKPPRSVQVEVLRWVFCATYMAAGTMFSVFLTSVTHQHLWLCNIATDMICIAAFLYICRHVHDANEWVIFPKKIAFSLSIILGLNLYLARIIGLYSNADKMGEDEEESWTYTNAMLIVLFSIIPISTYALFWAVCNMLFHSEFTSCPENYNAVHDPGITLVSVQTMVEGALDVISCAALLSLATEPDLPLYMDCFIVFFAFMEIINACQCFVLQVMLSGGHDDTPAHLVLLRSRLRQGRGMIDLGTFSLRLVLWLHFDAVASVFMIKNLFNLLHTLALVERSKGVQHYSAGTLFLSYVSPRDWYGMTKEEWRHATRASIGEQARAGIAV